MPRATAKKQVTTQSTGAPVNIILGGLIILGLGMAYVWICVKERRLGEAITTTRREIASLERQIRDKEAEMNREVTPHQLGPRIESMALGLIDIPRDRIIRIPHSLATPR